MKVMNLWIFILFSVILSANEHYIFVVDGSGSMDGKPMMEAKDAIIKTAKPLLLNGGKISIIVGDTNCQSKPIVKSSFVDNLRDLVQVLKKVTGDGGGDNITLGFKHAENEMIQKGYDGHIYLFGDCDGLDYCESIESQANKLAKTNKLIPFTYLFVQGCSEEQKNNWNKMVVSIDGANTGAAASFDYGKIVQKKREKIEINKQYFFKPSFVNKDASKNSGNNYGNRPWRCIDSDGLLWLVLNKKEQDMNFFMKEPKTNAFYKKTNNNILISDYTSILNSKNICGRKDWRLPDIFELSRLTQLGPNRRSKLFPYIKIWPHISITSAQYTGYKKGIDLSDGQIYGYKEDRPYSAIFVAGEIDKTLFEPPIEFLTRYKFTNKIITNPKSKTLKDDIIDNISFAQVNNTSLNKWIESNTIIISGINASVTIAITNGEFRINGSGWSNIRSVVNNGDTLQVRHMSAKTEGSVSKSYLTIGVKSVMFISKTKKRTLKRQKGNFMDATGLSNKRHKGDFMDATGLSNN